jgi:antitoxin YefM
MTAMSYTKARANLLAGLEETAHLLRSPENARRLLTALDRARNEQLPATRPDDLRRELGLVDE